MSSAADKLSETSQQVQQEAIEQQDYEDSIRKLSIELTQRAETLRGTFQGQCVVGARNFLGVGRDVLQGMAKNTKTNSKDPEVGSIIKLGMSRYGHVGVVLYTTEAEVFYYDSNGDWRQRGAIRQIKINDKRIKGYKIVEAK